MQFAGSPTAQQVAAGLLDAGLAQQIADKIQASTLSADTGTQTATQVLQKGVKLVDQPVPIHDALVTVANNGSEVYPTTLLNAGFDTTDYQTLILTIDWQTNVTYAPNQYVRVDIAWSNGEFTGLNHSYAAVQTLYLHGQDDRGVSAVRVPCMGSTAKITIVNHTGAAITFHYWLQGSQRVADDIHAEQNVGSVAVGGGVWDVNAAQSQTKHLTTTVGIPNAAGALAPLPPRGGLVEIAILPTTTTTAVGRFTILDHLAQRVGPQVQMPVGTPLVARISWQAQLGYHPAFVYNDVAPAGAGPLFVSATYL